MNLIGNKPDGYFGILDANLIKQWSRIKFFKNQTKKVDFRAESQKKGRKYAWSIFNDTKSV